VSDNLLDKYIRAPDKAEPHEPSVIRGEGHLPRLEILESNNNSRSFPYISLRYMRFNPSEGIQLYFHDDMMVELKGSYLRPLYEALHDHAVKTVLVLKSGLVEVKGATVVDGGQFTLGDDSVALE